MKTKNFTFSLPLNVANQLTSRVAKREMSKFAAQALKEALERQAEDLKRAYAEANEDQDREEVLKDWATLDSEGLDDDEWKE